MPLAGSAPVKLFWKSPKKVTAVIDWMPRIQFNFEPCLCGSLQGAHCQRRSCANFLCGAPYSATRNKIGWDTCLVWIRE
eukprot:6464339-Amphidinium_carterae.1